MKKFSLKSQPFVVVGLGLFLIGAGSYFKHDRVATSPSLDGGIVPSASIMSAKSAAAPASKPTFSIRGAEFEALMADTPVLREKGLSGMRSLGAGQAMVFVFERPDVVGFWMKDMLFSIDILFLDENMRAISSARRVSPETYPEAFYPEAPAKYVVEFPAGTLDRLGVKRGDAAEIRP